jgi:DNA-binding response OmpR family regulator
MEASSSHSAGEHASVDAVDVAIVDHIRSAREKLGAALEDLGFKVHLPDDLAAWLDELRAAPPVVVIAWQLYLGPPPRA